MGFRNFEDDAQGFGAPGTFGAESVDISRLTLFLDNARDKFLLTIPAGVWIWEVDATDFDVNVELQFNMQSNAKIPFRKGQFMKNLRFERVYITHPAQSNKTLTLLTGQQLDLDVVSPGEQRNDNADSLDTLEDDSVASLSTEQITSTKLTRREALIQNLSTQYDFRVGDSNVDATRGILIKPGEIISIKTTDEIYAFNTGPIAQSIATIEISD